MWLFIAFLAVPLIEIALFVQVGGLIGLWPTLLIVILTAILGTWLVRSQGLMALDRLRWSFNELSDPTEPLAHGAMILLAGALLLTPGFFTDAVGFALLMPGFRTAAFAWLRKRVRVTSFKVSSGPSGPGGRRETFDGADGDVIETEFHEVDPPKRPTHSVPDRTRH